MAITRQTMTDEQRKSVALEYLKAFDNKGVTSTGGSILDLFADDAQVFFPKWGLANGKKQIGQLFTDFGGGIKSILHDYATFNWIMTGTDVFAVEGTSAGEHKEGPWRAGVIACRSLVRRVRGSRLPDSALLHLSRSGLRRARHGALSLAVGGRARSVEADGITHDAKTACRTAARAVPCRDRPRAGRHRQRAREVPRPVHAGRRDSRGPSVRQPQPASMPTNQIILIRGDRIADVGPSVAIPADARVIDLSAATVHARHDRRARPRLSAGRALAVRRARSSPSPTRRPISTPASPPSSTWIRAAATARSICATRSIAAWCSGRACRSSGSRSTSAPARRIPSFFERFQDRFTESKNPNSPWLARAAVREAKLHGVDWVKIYTTQDFVGDEYSVFKPDGTLVNSPSLTEEEVMAITDEAHRLGLKVACHTYGGEGQLSCLKAGVDAPNHLTDLDDASLKLLVDKKLPFELTIDDLVALEPADLKKTGGRNSRLKMAEQAFKKAYAAGVPFVFGSGATSADVPHGKQADQFAYFIKWGIDARARR